MKYDKDFRDFLIDNIDEILSNPEYTAYLSKIQRQFAEIKAINSNRKLTLELAKNYVVSTSILAFSQEMKWRHMYQLLLAIVKPILMF